MERLFDKKDCREMQSGETYKDKFVIVHKDFFKPEFRNAKYQLFYATGGFGCDPAKLGNAVFGADIEEDYRQEAYNIIGIASEEAIQTWEKEYGFSREDIIKIAKGNK